MVVGSDRGRDGKFLPGNKANPLGKPKQEKVNEYYRLTVNNVSEEDWVEITRKAVEKAARGDRYARDWLTKVLIGNDIGNKAADRGVAKVIIEHITVNNNKENNLGEIIDAEVVNER